MLLAWMGAVLIGLALGMLGLGGSILSACGAALPGFWC